MGEKNEVFNGKVNRKGSARDAFYSELKYNFFKPGLNKDLLSNLHICLDFEWCLTDNAETQERGRFFLIILNLATIEVSVADLVSGSGYGSVKDI